VALTTEQLYLYNNIEVVRFFLESKLDVITPQVVAQIPQPGDLVEVLFNYMRFKPKVLPSLFSLGVYTISQFSYMTEREVMDIDKSLYPIYLEAKKIVFQSGILSPVKVYYFVIFIYNFNFVLFIFLLGTRK